MAVYFVMALAGSDRAFAQATLDDLPPVRPAIDENGIDLTTGYARASSPKLSIGEPGSGGMVYQAVYTETDTLPYRWRDNYFGTLNNDPETGKYIVSWGGGSEVFSQGDDGLPHSDQGSGAALEWDSVSGLMIYTRSDGTQVAFSGAYATIEPILANQGRVAWVKYPNGEHHTYTYRWNSGHYSNRLQSVVSNFGYQIKIEYHQNTWSSYLDDDAWLTPSKVTAINMAVDYCDPTALSCTGLTQAWPTMTFTRNGGVINSATDNLGRTWQWNVTGSVTTRTLTFTSPSNAVRTIAHPYAYGVSVTDTGGGTWYYAFAHSGGVTTATVTSPSGGSRVVLSDSTTHQVSSDTDELGRTTTFTRDSKGRVTRTTFPEGNYVDYAYDDRGNVTQVTRTPKAGSGLSPIVTSATYDIVCSNRLTCNKPNTTTDARGATTNYTYDPSHGGALTVTAPVPAPGVARPEGRTAYAQHYAWYKNSAGVVVQAPTPVYLPVATSACVTGTSCSGAANEVKTTFAYGVPGGANNLLVTSVSTGAGDGSLVATGTFTYDNIGNRLTADGPRPGTADTTRYRYDAGRQLVGVVKPDPDGSGPRKHGAVRTTYNPDGQTVLIEQGSVNGQADADWSGFVSLLQRASVYDGLRRKITDSYSAGGSAVALTQYSYDGQGRVDCVAARMNPAAYGSLPGSACTPTTAGSSGPDRIQRYTYDAASHVTKVTIGYGTAAQADEATLAYTVNGRQASVTDANGNKTTYEYDGFDRLSKVRFPSATTAGTSSTVDYEQVTYDAESNVTLIRRRDGQTISFTYDALNRETAGDAGVTRTYDNLSRPTSVTSAGQTITLAWDALNRKTSEAGALGTVASQYDLSGRRTRLTWTDGFYVTYDYDEADQMTAIRENGASSGVGVLAAFAYDDQGRRTSVSRGNGVTTTYTYAANALLGALSHDMPGTASDQTLTFTYNTMGQLTARSASNSAYDAPAPTAVSRSYGLNGLNQVTTSGALALSYDGRGNLTSDGTNTYTYDILDQLTGVSGASLSYDAEGRLFQTAGAAVTRFGYDEADLIAEYDGATGLLLRRYIHGPANDEPLVWYEGGGVTDRRWLTTDNMGSVVAGTNSAGAVTFINTYNEYGVPGASNQGRFQYTGQTWLPEAGVYYFKTRVYSPTLGRFLQADQIGYGSSLNAYAYVDNDPLSNVDPTGWQSMSPSQVMSAADVDACLADPYCAGSVSEVVITALTRGQPDKRPWGEEYKEWQQNHPILDTVLDFVPVVGSIKGVVDFAADPTIENGVFAAAGVFPPVKWLNGARKGVKLGWKVLRTGCFEAGTIVETEAGPRRIEDIRVGDRVLSRDPETGETAFKRVTALLSPPDSEIYDVTFELTAADGAVVRETVRATQEHPWRTAGDTWLTTRELAAGTQVRRAEGAAARVVSVAATGRVVPVYNFEVEDYGTYFVGKAKLWVHNSCWKRIAETLEEQMAMNAAKRGEGELAIRGLGDGRYKGMDKWQYVLRGKNGTVVTVHYVKDPATGALMDFKVMTSGVAQKFTHGP